jgi:DNA-binding response OmpR family regulator
LVVEDEWLIAEALVEQLKEEGFEPVGPTGSVRGAIALLDQESVDVAVLDISLNGEKSFAIADSLVERGVPFVFLSGYVDSDFPAQLRLAPTLTKPVRFTELQRSLLTLLASDPK